MAQDPSGSSKDPKDKAQPKGPSGQPPAQTGAGSQQGPGSWRARPGGSDRPAARATGRAGAGGIGTYQRAVSAGAAPESPYGTFARRAAAGYGRLPAVLRCAPRTHQHDRRAATRSMTSSKTTSRSSDHQILVPPLRPPTEHRSTKSSTQDLLNCTSASSGPTGATQSTASTARLAAALVPAALLRDAQRQPQDAAPSDPPRTRLKHQASAVSVTLSGCSFSSAWGSSRFLA